MKVAIEDIAADALAAEWAGLSMPANPSPYRSAAWIAAWAPMAGRAARLKVARGSVDGRTLALAVFGVRSARLGQGRAARLFETGQAALDGVYVEYNDAWLAADAPQGARRALLAMVLDRTRAQSVVLRNVVPPMRQAALAAGRDAAWIVRVVSENPCYGTPLGPPPPFSRNTRQQVARSRRLYEAHGPLTVEVADDPAARAEALPRLIAMHEAVWCARGQAGAFGPQLRAFHEALAARPDAPCEILTVRAGERPVGMLLNLVGADTAHNYQSGFAVEADNRLKPGLVSHAAAMAHYAGRGLAHYDMMAGESRYKASLGAPHRRLSTLELERPSLRQRLRGVARNVRR